MHLTTICLHIAAQLSFCSLLVVFPCSDNNSLSEVIQVKVSQRLNANTCDSLSDMTPANRSKHNALQVKCSMKLLIRVSE